MKKQRIDIFVEANIAMAKLRICINSIARDNLIGEKVRFASLVRLSSIGKVLCDAQNTHRTQQRRS